MEVLKISHKVDISAKNMLLQELQQSMEGYNDVPTTEEFIKEVLELNSFLMKKQEHFFQKMSHITPYLITSDQLTNKVIDWRIDFTNLSAKNLEHRMAGNIRWKENQSA